MQTIVQIFFIAKALKKMMTDVFAEKNRCQIVSDESCFIL